MKIAGLIPAAGLSSRMGAFKPLLPVDREDGCGCVTVLERVVNTLRSGGADRVFVVTGKNAEKLRGVIASSGAEEIYNKSYMLGMSFSVTAGVRAADEAGADGALLLPCDTPAVQSECVKMLLAAADSEHFAVACYKGKKGHPLWIPRKYFKEILFSGSVKNVTRAHEDEMIRVETGRESVVLDMDTPRAYQRVLDYLLNGETDLAMLAKNRRIILVRHCETERHAGPIFMGQTDVPLSTRGLADTIAAGGRVRALEPKVTTVYSSDLRRASATAAAVAGRLGAKMALTAGLREISLGDWDGRPVADIAAAFPKEYEKRGADLLKYKPQGGENFYDLRYRAASCLIEILKRDPSPDVLIVTHAGTITAIRSAVTGLDMDPADKLPPGGMLTITGEDYGKS